MSAPQKRWQKIEGVLFLDKALGISSNLALQQVRRLFQAEKAGHTGTLDPLATGLLPICFGEATKFSADLLEADKTYEARISFGKQTDTGDKEGKVIRTRPVTFSEDALLLAMASFIGKITQIPPMHSALKHEGRALYELARQGKAVERAPRQIMISELTLLAFSGQEADVRVRCSKGTYIRTLAEDLGEALSSCAHLAALRRTGVADFSLSCALTLASFENMTETERKNHLLPVDFLLQNLLAYTLTPEAASRFCHGNPVLTTLPEEKAPSVLRLYEAATNRFLGVGALDADGHLHPKRLLSQT